MDVFAVFILPDGKPPALKKMNGRIHMPGNVEYQVIPGNAHHVIADVSHVIIRAVILIRQAEV